MTVVFDTETIPEADRVEVMHAVVAEGFCPVRIEFADDQLPVSGKFSLTDLGGFAICTSVSSAVELHRTAALVRDDSIPSLFLALQMTGSSVIAQRGRQVTLRPGQLAVYDSTSPWTISDPDGIKQHKFRIPLDRLGLPESVVAHVCATALSPGHPIADLASTYFTRLTTLPESFQRPGGDVVSKPSIELLRAVITTHLDAVELGKESRHATLCLRITEYARTHLQDPDLCASQIAAEHHISTRHLYKILAANGVQLSDWIRTQRLIGCRAEIATAHSTPLAVIARRWGFNDASSFARVFRTHYGVSPREWRNLHRPSAVGQRPPNTGDGHAVHESVPHVHDLRRAGSRPAARD